MIKITHKDVSLLINRSNDYTRQLLSKEKVSLKSFPQVINFISRNRLKTCYINRENIFSYTDKVGISELYAIRLFEKMVGLDQVFESHKKKVGSCERCGAKNPLALHHKDRNHWNNDPNNWKILCNTCHVQEHFKDKRNFKNKNEKKSDRL